MNRQSRLSSRSQRAAVLVSALVFCAVISVLLAGIATLTVSHYQRAYTEANYSAAINLAEAGINYELRNISTNGAAHQRGAPYSGVVTYPGISGTVPGSYSVFVTNWPDNGAAWNKPNPVQIWATGTITEGGRTVRRTLRVCGQSSGTSLSGAFAMYGISSVVLNNNATVYGNVGTNGSINIGNNSTIGKIGGGVAVLAGPGATITKGSNSSATVTTNPDAIQWDTVSNIALAKFPSGGLSYLATTNNNSMCSLIKTAVLSNLNQTTVVLPSTAGGVDYYLTGLTMKNGSKLILDNTLGPVTLWLVGNGNFTGMNNCEINAKVSTGGYEARIYMSGTGTFTVMNNASVGVGLYAPLATINVNNNGRFAGSIIAKTVSMTNNGTSTYTGGFFTPLPIGGGQWWGFWNNWNEDYGAN